MGRACISQSQCGWLLVIAQRLLQTLWLYGVLEVVSVCIKSLISRNPRNTQGAEDTGLAIVILCDRLQGRKHRQLHHPRHLAVSAVLSFGGKNRYGYQLSCAPLVETQRHDINLAEVPSPSLTPGPVPPNGRVYRKEQATRTHGLGHTLTDKSK